ncbi:hypothetical protein WDZ92_44920, partial [Nostoc sp. NIES-2111]
PYTGYSGIRIQPISASDTYGVGHQNADSAERRARIKRALTQLETLRPAIAAGWITPVPHLRIWRKRAKSIETQVRHDILNLSLLETLTKTYANPPAQSDDIRGLTVLPHEGVIPTDHAQAIVESPMLYFDSALAVADSTYARFLPSVDSDYSLLKQRIVDAGTLSRSVRDGLVVGGVKKALLPTFEHFSFRRCVKFGNLSLHLQNGETACDT